MKFSPGAWYKRVPKSMLANLCFRKAILEAARDEPIQKALLHVCKNDIVFWINVFGFQFNPDKMEKGPFITYPFQDVVILGGEMGIGGAQRRQWGILECVEDREDLRLPKSRYVGASWIAAFVAVYLCLFHDNVKGLVLSKDEETAEDTDNPDSIFWKIQYIIDHLPDWMSRGAGKKKKGVILFTNGNTITSTAKVESAGVGGRATFMIVDEFGQFGAKGHEIYSMTRDTARSRIFVFTHKGRDTMAYALCADIRYAEMRETVIHWSMDPERGRGRYRYIEEDNRIEVLDKSYEYPHDFRFVMQAKPAGGPFPGVRSPWYDKTCKGRSEYDIAMNLDIDPTGSTITFFDGYRIGKLKADCREPVWRGRLEFDKDNGTPKRLVEDPKGFLKLWVGPVSDVKLPNMRAGAGVDVSDGTGRTPSCLSLLNATTGDKVLSYEDANIYAVDFAALVAAVLRMVRDDRGNHPKLIWEHQGGATFAKRLLEDCKYYDVYRRRDEDTPGKPIDIKYRAGWNVTSLAILKIMEEYRDALYERRVTNWDEHALDELMYFVYVGKGVEYKGKNHGKVKDADSGASIHHGDIVRADALAYKMICELGFEKPQLTTTIQTGMPNPRSSGFREWLAEQTREEEEVWA